MKDSKNFLFTLNIFLWELDNGVMFLYVLKIYRKQLYTQQEFFLMKWSIKNCEACI
jgi:hypothetical protein